MSRHHTLVSYDMHNVWAGVLFKAVVKLWELPKISTSQAFATALAGCQREPIHWAVVNCHKPEYGVTSSYLDATKDSPGTRTEAQQQLDIQICTNVLQVQIANSRSPTIAWVKKVCHVLLGNHHASGTRPVGFVWRSHRPADHARAGCDNGPPAFASVL